MKKWGLLIGLFCLLPMTAEAYRVGDTLTAEMVVLGVDGPIPPPPGLNWRWEMTGAAARLVGDTSGQAVAVEMIAGGSAQLRMTAERGLENWSRGNTFRVDVPTPTPTPRPVIIQNIILKIGDVTPGR